MIQSLYCAWFYISDWRQSLEFYRDKLGLKVRLQNDGWIEFELGDSCLAILERPKAKGSVKPRKTRLMLQTGDIIAEKQRLESLNVPIIGEIRDEEYGKLLTFTDPDNNWLELFEINNI